MADQSYYLIDALIDSHVVPASRNSEPQTPATTDSFPQSQSHAFRDNNADQVDGLLADPPPFSDFSVLVHAKDPDLDPDMGDGVGIKADVWVRRYTSLSSFLDQVQQSVVSKLSNPDARWTLIGQDPDAANPTQSTISDIHQPRDWEALRQEGQLDPDRGPELWLVLMEDGCDE
jgi:hypothetical protein